MNGRDCGCIGTVDSRCNFAQSHNETKTLKQCFSCHIHCAHLCIHVVAIVIASCAISLRNSQYPRDHRLIKGKNRGTRPDYLIRTDQKNEGPWGWTIWAKRQKNRELATKWALGAVEAHGHLMLRTNVLCPGIKYESSKIALSSVTRHIWRFLLCKNLYRTVERQL